MKKIICIPILILCSSWFIFPSHPFQISLAGNYLLPADADYKTIYGQGMMYPELKIGYRITKGLYVWIGYGYLTAEGTIPIIEEAATSTQHHASIGAGYSFKIAKFMNLMLEAGSFNVYYQEKSQYSEETGIAFGYRGDGSLVFFIGKNLFAGLSGGYVNAPKTINSNEVKFGGFKAGVIIGVSF